MNDTVIITAADVDAAYQRGRTDGALRVTHSVLLASTISGADIVARLVRVLARDFGVDPVLLAQDWAAWPAIYDTVIAGAANIDAAPRGVVIRADDIVGRYLVRPWLCELACTDGVAGPGECRHEKWMPKVCFTSARESDTWPFCIHAT